MSSILSEQNLQTFRRRNIGRRCAPSLPCCPAAPPVRPRPPPPPPPPNVLRPFIASPPHPCRTDRRGRHPPRAVPHPAADPAATRGQHGVGAMSRHGGRACVRPLPAPRQRAPPGDG